jgi:tetratricopeptide (TPR) repeat protein
MSQRQLVANQKLVESAATTEEQARLLQDRAVLLARLGRIDDAGAAIDRANEIAGAEAPPVFRLRSGYAQAIRTYFSKRFAEALKQMLDARDGAYAACLPVLVAECESALALFMQREGDIRASARFAHSVLEASEATLESRYRAYLALATLHQDAYDYEVAASLFHEAEPVVKQLDDDVATASWLQRGALTQAAHARQAAALGELNAATLRSAIEALKRGIDFAKDIEGGPDTTLDYLMLAEMNVLQKRYREALALYDAHLARADGDGFMHEATAAQADRARCRMELGELDAGYADLLTALRRVDESTPSDIRAIVHDNMVSALERLGHAAEAEQHRLLARMAWDTYGHEQREARRLLQGDPPATVH